MLLLWLLSPDSFGQLPGSPERFAHPNFSSAKRHISVPLQHDLRIGIPVAMIGYGFVALKNDGFNDLDLSIKNEIAEDHPHFSFKLDDYLQYAPAVAVYTLNLSGIHRANNLRDLVIISGIASLTEAITVNSIKHLSHVQKPYGGSYLAFPSGHTATAFATAELLRREYKDVSPWIGIAGYTAATITGALRIYNNKHWFSDVVAGAGLGILSTDLAYAIYPAIRRKLFVNSRSRAIVIPYYHVADKGMALVFSF